MKRLANEPRTRVSPGEAEFEMECSGVSVERRILFRRNHKHPDSAPWMGPLVESLRSLLRMHWDHEPGRAQRRAGVPPAWRARQRERFRSVGVADGGRRDACPTLRFMERWTKTTALNLALSPLS